MCEPVTMAMAALGVGSALFGNNDKPTAPPPPPPVIPPARDPLAAREAAAEVRVGDGALKTSAAATPQYDGFTEKRVTGKPLGGLGRGGLGL